MFCPECGCEFRLFSARQSTKKIQKWTPEEVKYLIKSLKQGLTHREIGKKVNKDRSAVSEKVRYLRKTGKLKRKRR